MRLIIATLAIALSMAACQSAEPKVDEAQKAEIEALEAETQTIDSLENDLKTSTEDAANEIDSLLNGL